MFEKCDVLQVEFVFKGMTRTHKSITRLPKGAVMLSPGMRISLTCDSDARVGKEIEGVFTDIRGDKKTRARAVLITAEHLKGVKRGWYSIIEIKEVFKN